MGTPYTYQLKHDQNGRIVEKTETVAGKSVTWKYSYDKEGRLHEAHLDGRLICQCDYDREGRRSRDYFPATVGPHYRNYQYTMDNRLMRAGNNTYTHDDSGFRSIWSSGGTYYLYEHAPDYRLLKMEVEGESRTYTFKHDEDGQRVAKYLNGQPVEGYQWLDFVRLAGFHDGESGYEFAYNDGERTPFAMRRDDGAIVYLFYDQVGSLRVVADTSGNVIKDVLYDPFGGLIEDTNPALRIPIGFAGGLHDRDLGFVRFGWRDYDTYTGRWTAPDPIGDRGGDSDWYGYCLDDPVNGVDPLGLFTDILYYDGNMGHVAIATEGKAPVGKYPETRRDVTGGKGIYKEETDKPASSVRLNTTAEQEAYINEYLNFAKKSTSVEYDVLKKNCVKGVNDALQAGGITTPKRTKGVHPAAYMDMWKNK